MKNIFSVSTVVLLACGTVLAEDSASIGQVKAAIAKLRDQPNYTWTTKMDMSGMRFGNRPLTGKTQKGGFTVVSQETSNSVVQAIFKGTNVCLKVEDEWQLTTEMEPPAAGGGFNRGAFMGRMLSRTRLAADEATNLLARVNDLKAEDGGLYTGNLTEEGAKALLTFGGRGGRRGGQGSQNGPPPPKDAKGTVKFWTKDGVLTKFESVLTATMNIRGEDRETKRTMSTEIKDIGSTQLDVPPEAKKKLSRS
jgi:hypothetical protein